MNEEIFSSLIEISFVDTDLILVDFVCDDFHSFQWNNLHNKPRRSVLLEEDEEEEEEDEDELDEDEEEDDSFLEKRLFFEDSELELSWDPLDLEPLDLPPDPEPLEPFFLPICNFLEEDDEEDSSV